MPNRELLDAIIADKEEKRGRPLTAFEQMNNLREAMLDEERKAVLAIENAKADEQAVWALADYFLPSDVREFGERHGIPELASELWRGAFVAGWRAALRKEPDKRGRDYGEWWPG